MIELLNNNAKILFGVKISNVIVETYNRLDKIIKKIHEDESFKSSEINELIEKLGVSTVYKYIHNNEAIDYATWVYDQFAFTRELLEINHLCHTTQCGIEKNELLITKNKFAYIENDEIEIKSIKELNLRKFFIKKTVTKETICIYLCSTY